MYIVVNHRPQNYDERLHFTILIFLVIMQFLRLPTTRISIDMYKLISQFEMIETFLPCQGILSLRIACFRRLINRN